jgi:hypothetical protein
MIVSVTRDNLRDEFIMADDAFALSPISARATQPREEDYDAISDAFMETSRGRWFLGEYARRNRNADTRMVLDAVARIEENLAAQKQPAPESGLAEALAAISNAVEEARASASAQIDGMALEPTLAPIRKGARVIREIAWRLREIGSDGRICDLIDSQVSAIEAGCGRLASTDPGAAIGAAFDLIKQRIAGFGDSEPAPAPTAAEASPSPSPVASDEAPAAAPETLSAAMTTDASEAAIGAAELPEATDEAETAGAAETSEMTVEAAVMEDEAILEMVALEMAAPDVSDADDDSADDYSSAAIDEVSIEETQVAAEPMSSEPEIIAPKPEPIAAPALPPMIQPSLEASLQPSQRPSQPSPQPSLGSTLIANGIVRRPNAPASDPLASIRRMSQAEKIAFFS